MIHAHTHHECAATNAAIAPPMPPPPRHAGCSTIMRCVCMNHVQLSSLAGINRSSASSNRGTLLPQTSRLMLSGVEGAGARTILGGSENHSPSLEAHSSVSVSIRGRASRLGVRESRVRGGAASWPNLAAVAVCGGVQECNLVARVGTGVGVVGAWADTGLICQIAHWPRARGRKEFFSKETLERKY